MAIQPAPLDEVRVYSLAEVAEVTGMSKNGIEDDCRAGRVMHVKCRRSMGMTVEHIRKLVATYTQARDTAAGMSEMDWVIEMSRRASRRGRRRPS